MDGTASALTLTLAGLSGASLARRCAAQQNEGPPIPKYAIPRTTLGLGWFLVLGFCPTRFAMMTSSTVVAEVSGGALLQWKGHLSAAPGRRRRVVASLP
jgi:hypothetical protein